MSGPSWTVKLGRRDATRASQAQAESDLPLFTDSLDRLISRFGDRGLSPRDLVALSGNYLNESYMPALLRKCYIN